MAYQIQKNNLHNYRNNYNFDINFNQVFAFHHSLSQYYPTPLHNLNGLAKLRKVKRIYVKDESCRFNLNAFKGLGVSYAMNKVLEKNTSPVVFVTATDGNHGRAVAWYAKYTGNDAIIFMPHGSEQRRVKAIEEMGARTFVLDLNYDDTVRYADKYASENNYVFLQDTATEDNEENVRNIILGYSTLVEEALSFMDEKPTHVFVQAGVGSLAGGVIWYLSNRYKGKVPYIGVIESSACPCIYESVVKKSTFFIEGMPKTNMAGLNCGEPNYMTLPLIDAYASWVIQCDDDITIRGMELARHPVCRDPAFSSGESGAVGLGFIDMVLQNKQERDKLKIDENSIILLFSTEGELRNE